MIFCSVTSITARRCDYTDKPDVPLSIQSGQQVEFINSDQPRRGKTFVEHRNSFDETAEELLTVKRLSAVRDHPLVAVTPRQLFTNYSAGVRWQQRRQERAAILNEVLKEPLAA